MGASIAWMTGDSQTSKDELPLGRLEAFSDGVFAIAITLLVLELGVTATADGDLVGAILAEWPAYLAYVTSFLTIGVIWMRHSAVTAMLRAGDATLFRINLVVLLLAAFLPFPTKLVGEFIGDPDPERVAVLFYGGTLLLLDLALFAFARYGVEDGRHLKPGMPADRVRDVAAPVSLAFYGIAMAVSILLPIVGVALFLSIAVYIGVPGRTIRRLLRTTSADPG
jgi:uncharacterized membrane protein